MKYLFTIILSCCLTFTYCQNSQKNYSQLEELCKVWGYLKYYDADISQGRIDWDSVLINTLPEFYTPQSKENFNTLLNQFFISDSNISTTQTTNENLRWINQSSLLNTNNKRILLSKFSNTPKTKYYIQLNERSKNCLFPNEKKYKNLSFPNKEYQMLTLFRYWNAIEYFYPYKDLIDKSWSDILSDYLPKFYTCKIEKDFHLLVFKLTTELKDSHVQTGSDILSSALGYYFPLFYTTYINNKYIVSGFINDSIKKISPFKIGDEILYKKNTSLNKLDSNLRSCYRASNNATTNKYIADWILLGTTDTFSITINRNNDTLKIKDNRILRVEKLRLEHLNRQGNPFQLVENNIGYLKIESLYNHQIDSIFKLITPLKNLIIDLRGYPNETYYSLCLKLLNKNNIDFVKVNYTNIYSPYDFSNEFTLQINGDSLNYYKGKVILLIDETTQSQGEFTAMALENAPNCIKVGSQTAGADGNVSIINLPFGIVTSFSGVRISYPNGKQTQRIGIVPDITIEKDYLDIINGIDTQKEFAIKYLIKHQDE